MAANKRLSTCDIVVKMWIQCDVTCKLCNVVMETHEHFFSEVSMVTIVEKVGLFQFLCRYYGSYIWRRHIASCKDEWEKVPWGQDICGSLVRDFVWDLSL